jgi:FkbH-like protein
MLPAVEVWGEDPLSFRRRLLTDPRLQLPRITTEAANRSALVKAQLDRQKLATDKMSEADYLASLQIKLDIETLAPGSQKLPRVEELFQRTTQFNTTGVKFSGAQLGGLMTSGLGAIYAMSVTDRFADHGLVGAIVVMDGEILGLAMSCRVLGMGVEHRFVQHVIDDLKGKAQELYGRIIETPRNLPVRNIYRDNGFVEEKPGLWARALT